MVSSALCATVVGYPYVARRFADAGFVVEQWSSKLLTSSILCLVHCEVVLRGATGRKVSRKFRVATFSSEACVGKKAVLDNQFRIGSEVRVFVPFGVSALAIVEHPFTEVQVGIFAALGVMSLALLAI